MPRDPKLVFIVKTPASKNLSHSDGLERSKIFSHVQQGPHSQKPVRLDSVEARLHPQHRTPRLSSDRTAPRNRRSTQLDSASSDDATCASSVNRKGSPQRRPPRACPAPELALVTLARASAELVFGASGMMNQYMKTLLDFYDTPLILRVHHTSKAVVSSRQDTISYALHNPALLAALLCATSSAMYVETEKTEHLLSSIHFKGQMISHLKGQINESSGAEALMPTLYAISILLWAECLQGNITEMQAHLSGLRNLLDCLEGNLPESSAAVGMIYACSHLCAAITQTRPQPPLPSIQHTTFSPSALTAIQNSPLPSISKMSTSFFTPGTTHLISPHLVKIISRQCLYIAFNTLCTLNHITPSDSDLQVSVNLQLLVEHDLLLLPLHTNSTKTSTTDDFATTPSPRSTSKLRLTPIQDAVRLALFVFAQPICSIVRSRSAFSQSIAGRLYRHLQIAGAICPEEERDAALMVWLLFVLAYVGGDGEEGAWAVEMMGGLVEGLGVRTIEGVRELLDGFYFIEEWFEGTLRRVWEGVRS